MCTRQGTQYRKEKFSDSPVQTQAPRQCPAQSFVIFNFENRNCTRRELALSSTITSRYALLFSVAREQGLACKFIPSRRLDPCPERQFCCSVERELGAAARPVGPREEEEYWVIGFTTASLALARFLPGFRAAAAAVAALVYRIYRPATLALTLCHYFSLAADKS